MNIFEELQRMIEKAQAKQRSIFLSPDKVGQVVRVGDKLMFLDVARSMYSDMWIFIGIDEDGSIVPLMDMNEMGSAKVYQRLARLQPPKTVPYFEELEAVERASPKDVYVEVRELNEQLVVMPRIELYDFLALYNMSSWLHTLCDKKPFLFVTGFFGTGKSMVGSLIRQFARHPFDLLSSTSQSVLWTFGLTRGIGIIDETDRLSATFRMLLRRLHDEGISIVKMMVDEYGWSLLSLNLSSPIVLIGTHLPEDPALLSRGFIIKMHYGKPARTMRSMQNELYVLRLKMIKAMLTSWKRYLEMLEKASKELDSMDIHERYKDIAVPIVATAMLCDADWSWISLMIKYSASASAFQIKTNRAILYIVEKLRKETNAVAGVVALTEHEMKLLIDEASERVGLSDAERKYITTYFVSASEPCTVDGEPGFCFSYGDILGALKLYKGIYFVVDRKKGTVELKEFEAK